MIDLRSDTVTKPSAEMRKVMAEAEVGDDVWGDDPTVNRLQSMVAEILGKESALFVPSGTMSNQIAIKTHTQPGDEVIVEGNSHIFHFECAAPAIMSSVQLRPVFTENGIMRAADTLRNIRPDDIHQPKTRLVCVENTHNRASGRVYPLEVEEEISRTAGELGIATHLDGARLWNACVATKTEPAEHARLFDSVTVCLSKGLGAPVGSVLASSKEFISTARRHRQMMGGGMRQAGILAAAGIYALEHNIERLQEDHENARLLAEELAKIDGITINLESIMTNIVIFDTEKTGLMAAELAKLMKKEGILIHVIGKYRVRMLTHLGITREDVLTTVKTMKKILAGKNRHSREGSD